VSPSATDPGRLLFEAAAAALAAGKHATFDAALAATRASYPLLATAYHEGRLVAVAAPAGAEDKIGAPLVLAFRQALGGDLVGQRLERVPLFRAGTWNARKYRVEDLDAMVQAFGQLGFRPPVKVGHDTSPGALACGYVARVWREGGTLYGDLEGIPADVVKAIREFRLLTLSCEIFLDFARDGRRWSHALGAVALLGGHPPGVDLPPLVESLPPA
jgi:hypothetical protein